jgi:MoaA/NifB/PqqE/SkfB family radical SAM enzyme
MNYDGNRRADLERLLRKHSRYAVRYGYILPRVARNYFRLLVLRQKVLRGVEFALTYDCNCDCSHCSAAHLRDSKRKLLPFDRIRQALSQSIELGALNINLTGGEVLMRRDLEQLVRAAQPRRSVVSVATNGILLDGDQAVRLKKCGVRIVTISLDSSSPEAHDRSRGHAGCFRKVFEAVEHARRAGLEVFLCTILTPENLGNGDIYRMVELAAERRVTLTVNVSCPVGRWRQCRGVILSQEELSRFDQIVSSPHVRWEGGSNYLKEGCPAGVEKIYISPYGDVMPCNFTHISFGNVAEESLPVIWRRMIRTEPFNRIHDRCLVGANSAFREDYLGPLDCTRKLPVFYKDHPAFADEESREAEGSG